MRTVPTRTPDDALELEIVLLWERLLEQPTIRVDDNFFDIGGSSLLAIAMMAKLETLLGTKLRLADLFAAPTPQELAAHIRANGQMRESCIYALNNVRAAEITLYCVHPLSGSPMSYLPLVTTLDTEVTICGIQAVGLESDEQPATSTQDMARTYASELASRHTNDKYFLLGHSFGAYIAFEMAIALCEMGRAPQKVILIDPLIRGVGAPLAIEDDGKDELERLAPNFWNLPVDRAIYDRLDSDEKLGYVIRLALEHGRVSPFLSEEMVRRRMNVRRACYAASTAYTPSATYTGRLFVINAVHQEGVEETRAHWRRFAAGGVEFFDVPGAHYEILREPTLPIVRARVDQLLRAP